MSPAIIVIISIILRPSISGLFQSATKQSFWATNRENAFQAFKLPQIHLFVFGVGGGGSKNCQEIKRWEGGGGVGGAELIMLLLTGGHSIKQSNNQTINFI